MKNNSHEVFHAPGRRFTKMKLSLLTKMIMDTFITVCSVYAICTHPFLLVKP